MRIDAKKLFEHGWVRQQTERPPDDKVPVKPKKDKSLTYRLETYVRYDKTSSQYKQIIKDLMSENESLGKGKRKLEARLDIRESIEKDKPFAVLAEYGTDAYQILFFLEEREPVTYEQLTSEIDISTDPHELIAHMYQGEIIDYRNNQICLTDSGREIAKKF